MKAFENAKEFFTACETAQGWEACSQYVADNATFLAQSEPLIDINTVEAYCNWAYNFVTETVPGASYDLHSVTYDEERKTAVFFATYHAKHTGDGGPVPPTQQETHTHYVYVLTMNADNKITKVVKIWNAPWALKELGWQ